MNPEVELKLLNITSQFKNTTLKDIAFKEKEVEGKKYLILELEFLNATGHRSTMFFALDKDLTVNECENLYEEMYG